MNLVIHALLRKLNSKYSYKSSEVNDILFVKILHKTAESKKMKAGNKCHSLLTIPTIVSIFWKS